MSDFDSSVIQWLLEDDNPAIKYCTQNEILGQTADKAPVVEWLNASLPAGWTERTGLWSTYYLNSFAECGLTFEDIPLGKEKIIAFNCTFPLMKTAVIICVYVR